MSPSKGTERSRSIRVGRFRAFQISQASGLRFQVSSWKEGQVSFKGLPVTPFTYSVGPTVLRVVPTDVRLFATKL